MAAPKAPDGADTGGAGLILLGTPCLLWGLNWPMLAIAVLFPILFYLLPFSHAVQLSCLQYYAKPDKLTLGDWIGEDIKAEGKTIVSKESTGLSAAEINKVQELHDKGKVGNVLVKTGIPFIPSFLIAFVVTLWHGSLLTFVLHLLL